MKKDELVARLEKARDGLARAVEQAKQATGDEVEFPAVPEVQELAKALTDAGAPSDMNVACDSNC